jgi:hypothetical protein
MEVNHDLLLQQSPANSLRHFVNTAFNGPSG